MLRTVEMAISDARARGLDVEVRAVDDKEDERIAAEVAAELAADPSVVAVIGHKNSGPSRAGGPIYAAAGLTQITQCPASRSLSSSPRWRCEVLRSHGTVDGLDTTPMSRSGWKLLCSRSPA
jgi:branched-chain amino acid transport system substrate-binding protein